MSTFLGVLVPIHQSDASNNKSLVLPVHRGTRPSKLMSRLTRILAKALGTKCLFIGTDYFLSAPKGRCFFIHCLLMCKTAIRYTADSRGEGMRHANEEHSEEHLKNSLPCDLISSRLVSALAFKKHSSFMEI